MTDPPSAGPAQHRRQGPAQQRPQEQVQAVAKYSWNIDTVDVSVLAHVMVTYHLLLTDPPSAGPAQHRRQHPRGRGQQQQGTARILTLLMS